MSGRKSAVAKGAALLLVTLAAHLPALWGGFVWDDGDFLTRNPLIQAPDGLYRFWFTTEPNDYFPLTSTLLWVEWRLWGTAPMGYHAVNLLLHALNAVLLWRVLFRLRLPGAWLGALFFAVHPVTVQSAAWITEGKNTLSLLFMLLSLLTYLRAASAHFFARWYAISVALFLLALLAKTSVVMLPLALLLIAWWENGTVARRDLLRTAPFFALSLGMGLVTVWFQFQHAIGASAAPEGPAERLAAAGWAFWFYLYKALWPVNLSFLYPRWTIAATQPLSYLPMALAAGLFGVLVWQRRQRWARPLLLALGWFGLMLLPVLGFVPMSFRTYSLVSDHLQYLALIGIAALAAGAATAAIERWRPSARPAGVIAAAVLALALGGLTARQALHYRSNETLWMHVLQKDAGSWVAHNNLAMGYVEERRYAEAEPHLRAVLDLRGPEYAAGHNNLGLVLAALGRWDEAETHLREAVRLKPDSKKFRQSLDRLLASRPPRERRE